MKAIMVMFDSLNRHFLPNYGNQWVKAPNFRRLANQAVTFDQAWIGSMPCMPARRELHTGRYNFLHRSWGPLEPFDDSAPDLLKNHGIYSHHVTDHQHYFEDGGATYHERYSSWEFARGQEGDPWKGQVGDPTVPDGSINRESPKARQDWVNRGYMRSESAQPQAQTFDAGLEFIQTNASEDHWFLQIETFDPHEPFFTQQAYKDLYPHEYDGPHFDWPPYARVDHPRDQVDHMRYEYAALVSMCDAHLGKILDAMDQHDLWDDTMLIVTTDHGFLLGEHNWWAKVIQPFYNEVARIPFFLWDPRCGRRGVRNDKLVQNIDVPATLLDYFGAPLPPDMQGIPLRDTVATDAPTREAILFGVMGGHVNCTDGHHVYMHPPTDSNQPLNQYTLMPTHMAERMPVNELQDMELADPFSFTKGVRTLKIPVPAESVRLRPERPMPKLLFDLHDDPLQEHPLTNEAIEQSMRMHIAHLMVANDAPTEQFERLGLTDELAVVSDST